MGDTFNLTKSDFIFVEDFTSPARISFPSLPLRGKVPRNESDEVSDTVAFCEAEIIVSVGIHLIHRARSPFPLRGRLKDGCCTFLIPYNRESEP